MLASWWFRLNRTEGRNKQLNKYDRCQVKIKIKIVFKL